MLMTPYIENIEAWQESWDRQQEAYLPDREQRFAAMLDVVDAATDGAAPRLLDLAGGTLNFAIAGGAVGLVARLLERSAVQLRQATEETIRARERTARLAERESLARQIHDSVLQALTLVHKRGRELATGGPVPPDQVAGLAEMGYSISPASLRLDDLTPAELAAAGAIRISYGTSVHKHLMETLRQLLPTLA